MIQAVAIRKARVPAIAFGALALAAFGGFSAARLSAQPSTTPVTVEAPAVQVRSIQRVVGATSGTTSANGCGSAGAYVTGDMAGDASPAAIYAAMCGGAH